MVTCLRDILLYSGICSLRQMPETLDFKDLS